MTTTSDLRTVPVPNCPACGQEGRRLYAGRSDPQTSLAGGWCVSRCSRCGTLWLDPRPDPRDLADLYTGDYYTHDQPLEDWDTRLIHGRSLDGASFSHRLQVDLFGRFVGTDLALRGPLFRRLLVSLMWAVPHVRDVIGGRAGWMKPRRGARLLDVGCGGGDYLALMRFLGWDVQGVEPDPKACAAARGRFQLSVLNGDLATVDLPRASFDVVTSFHAIEHMERPFELIERGLSLLAPGGRMLIVTPNGEGLGHRLFRSTFSDLLPPRHLTIFSGKALSRKAAALGARVVECRSTARRGHTVWVDSNSIRRHGRLTRAPSRLRKILGVPFELVEAGMRMFYPMAGDEIVLLLARWEDRDVGSRS
jgi:2-polyprenyl-3-methyl-5-hydroxy-6-metoxy-1,4-benzoquinol methylase